MGNNWKNIIIHCSDSLWGSEEEIKKWHLERGWVNTGYHFVINNGWIKPDLYLFSMDGSVEVGRQIDGDLFVSDNEIGAHALGYNKDSIGICLIGKDVFTSSQLNSLIYLVEDLCIKFSIKISNVKGHRDIDNKKTCPNFDVKIALEEINIFPLG